MRHTRLRPRRTHHLLCPKKQHLNSKCPAHRHLHRQRMQVQKRAQQRHCGSQLVCRWKIQEKPRSPLHKRTPPRRRAHSPLQMRWELHRKPPSAKRLRGQMPPNAGKRLPPPQETHKTQHRTQRKRQCLCHDKTKHKLLWKTDLLQISAQKRQPTQRHRHRLRSQIRKGRPPHSPYVRREDKQQNCQLPQILLHTVQRK